MEPTGTTDTTDIRLVLGRIETLTDVGADNARAVIAMQQELFMFRTTFFLGCLIFGALILYRSQMR